MCRLTAIITQGEPLLLADILTRPRRSIIQQSFNCQERLPQSDIRSAYQKASLNGDGFGVGWYTTEHNGRDGLRANLSLLRDGNSRRQINEDAPTPDSRITSMTNVCSEDEGVACVFTSLKPAWADRNLYNLAEKISSRLFFAHIRAASSTLGPSHCAGCDGELPPWAVANGSVSTELCCHPFRCGRFLFMHNGSVGGFNRIRRDLLDLLPDPMFSFAITNSCIDSVCLFAVFLALLPSKPTEPSTPSAMKESVEQMISTICFLLDKEKIEETTLINIVVSDGECIVATRFVTNAQELAYESGKSPAVPIPRGESSPAMPASLYFATGTAWQQEKDMLGEFRMTHRDKRTDICIVTSEPLTSNPEDWMPVPRNTMILITPAIDLLLYPIASVGYLPSPLRQHSRHLPSVPKGESDLSDMQQTVSKTLAMSLADRLKIDFTSFLEMCAGGPKKTLESFDELPLLMLRSLEGVINELDRGIVIDGEGTKAWRSLERKLQDLKNRLTEAHAEYQAAALEDIRPETTRSSSVSSPGVSSAAFREEELGLDSTGGSQQCYQLIAGSCAILCLDSIMVRIEKHPGKTGESSGETASSALPVATKTYVFAGMQSGVVVIYDATSASVAPISFQAHVGGVLAMAVYGNPWTSGFVSSGHVITCEDCGSALPEVFLVTGGSDTSMALWDLSPLFFGGSELRLLSGTPAHIGGPKVSIAADDLLAVRLTFLPHQGDLLSLLVADCSSHPVPTNGCHHDPATRVCTVKACDTCLPAMRAAIHLSRAAGDVNGEPSVPRLTPFLGTGLHNVHSTRCAEDPGGNIIILIGFQSAKIGVVTMSELLRYFRHTQVMVSVLANAVSFHPAQQQALPLRVSRDFELKTLASGQLRVTFSSEQERESLRSLFTQGPMSPAIRPPGSPSALQQSSPTPSSPCNASSLAADECFRSLLADFGRNLRSVTLHASHSGTALWVPKCCRSAKPGCLYPPTGTVYCFEAPHELEVPLPEGAAASAPPGTYKVVTSTSRLKIVAQPFKGNGDLKIEMRFLPFDQSGVKHQRSRTSLVGPWLDESGHNGFVECLVCCGNGVICSGGGDGRLLLWGEGGTLVGELSGHHGGVLCVAYTEAPLDSPCRDMRFSTRRPPRDGTPSEKSLSTSEGGLECLQGLLFSGSRDRSIRVWDVEQLVCIQTLNVHTSEVLSLAVDASRNLLISGSANGELFAWQLDHMIVAFRLSLNASPSHAECGLYSGIEGRRILRSQDECVSFTHILLISDDSVFHTDYMGSPDGLPRADSMATDGVPAGLQLWAGRGDGKLGVWSLSERDIAENSLAENMDDSFVISASETTEDQLSTGILAVTKEQPMSPISARREHLGGVLVRPRTLVFSDTQKGLPPLQRRMSSRRVSGMVISPGAAMPSLPSLTTGARVDSRQSDFLRLLAQFVAYKSVSVLRSPPYVSGCVNAARFVAQLFEQALGANVDIVWPQRPRVSSEFHGDEGEEQPHPVVFGRLGTNPQHPTIVFYSHYDVVPVGSVPSASMPVLTDMFDCPLLYNAAAASSKTLPSPQQQATCRRSLCGVNGEGEAATYPGGSRARASEWQGAGWNTNPWKISCKDGYIYGRGVTDNKGPIICSLLAVKQFISEWRRKHRGRQPTQQHSQEANNGTTIEAAQTTKNDPAIPFNFVWICEGDEENGSIGLASAVAQKANWLQGARFLICNNSYWADDTTPCLVYGMRGVLDIRVEATSGAEDSGHHSGLHGGAVEEPMQNLVYLLGRLYDPATGRVTVPGFYDTVEPPEVAELDRVKAAAGSVKSWLTPATGMQGPEEILRKSWLEPSLSLLGISSSFKGKCVHVAGATRVIPSKACAEISLRLVPNQNPKSVFELIRNYLKDSFRKTSSSSKLTVQCLRQGRPWHADLDAPRARALYGAAHTAIKQVWGFDPLYIREGGSMPAIPFLADVLRRLPGPADQIQGSNEVAVFQLPFGQASDNPHLPNERLGIRQVEKGVDVLAYTLESLAARLADEEFTPGAAS